MLGDLVARGLRRPERLIVDGAAGLGLAITVAWDSVPVQRCAVHKQRALPAHAPEEIAERGKAFLRKRKLRRLPLADSLEEAGDQLFTFTRLPPSQGKSVRTKTAIERLREEFRRRIKTQPGPPSSDTAATPFRP